MYVYETCIWRLFQLLHPLSLESTVTPAFGTVLCKLWENCSAGFLLPHEETQEKLAISLLARHQQSKCGSEDTVFAYHSVVCLFFLLFGSSELNKADCIFTTSQRALATLFKTTCANRLLSDDTESEVHEGNAPCYLFLCGSFLLKYYYMVISNSFYFFLFPPSTAVSSSPIFADKIFRFTLAWKLILESL